MNDPDISAVLLDRITNQCPGFKLIDSAWFTDALDDLEQETPACLIYIHGDKSNDGESQLFITTQLVSVQYGIWIIADRNNLKNLRAEIRTALLGWQPTETHNPMHYAEGKAENISGDMIWWREFWVTQAHIRSTTP